MLRLEIYDFCHVVDKARYGCLFYGTKSKWGQLYANWRLEDSEVLSLKCIIDSDNLTWN